MMELVICGQTYRFNFGMGFLREINKTISQPVDGLKDVKKEIGLNYMIARVLNEEPDALAEVLLAANKGCDPRLMPAMIDDYIDNVEDIDALFAQVIDFLSKANATKKVTVRIREELEKEEQKAREKQRN